MNGNEGRKEILQMLKDGIITVDDAERLLKALSEGDKKESPASGAGKKQKTVFSTIEDAVAGIGPMIADGISEIGPAIRDALGDIGSDTGFTEESEADGYRQINPENGIFEIPEGSRLRILPRKGHLQEKGGAVDIKAGSGTECSFTSTGDFVLLQREKEFILRRRGGDLNLTLPDSVRELVVKSMGGEIRTRGIICQSELKTMGGSIRAIETGGNLVAKTMGGGLEILLSKGWNGELKAMTMGGNVLLSVPVGIQTGFSASTMAGEIRIGESINSDLQCKGFPFPRFTGTIGKGQSGSSIFLKTMAGNVTVKESEEKSGNTGEEKSHEQG
ncbi:MAG: hypothetical protein PHQ23_08230 [Candidatus Wallbacteria bacterium]|nr:hypothetical protein [Candidatus Wallbacteria bacterium]